MKNIYLLLSIFFGVFAFGQSFNYDPTFNYEGSGIDNSAGFVNSIVQQVDGKILIGGSFTGYNNTSRNSICRLNPDGTLDLSFDPGIGISSPNGLPVIQIIKIAPDGKIYIGGNFTKVNNITKMYIARLHSDGTLDTSFTPPNFYDTTVGTNAVRSIELTNDGGVIVAGTFRTIGPRNNFFKVNADGSLNTTFTGGAANIMDTEILANGQILTAGSAYPGSIWVYHILKRRNSDGTYDSSFTPVIDQFSGGSYCVKVLEDSKILVSGIMFVNSVRTCVVRMNPDGTIDNSFIVVPLEDSVTGVNNVRDIDTYDNKYIITGLFSDYAGASYPNLAMLNADGSIDNTVFFNLAQIQPINDFLVLSNGKILIAGTALINEEIGFKKLYMLSPDTMDVIEFQKSNFITAYREETSLIYKSQEQKIELIEIYDLTGRCLAKRSNINNYEFRIDGIGKEQLIISKIYLEDGSVVSKKML